MLFELFIAYLLWWISWSYLRTQNYRYAPIMGLIRQTLSLTLFIFLGFHTGWLSAIGFTVLIIFCGILAVPAMQLAYLLLWQRFLQFQIIIPAPKFLDLISLIAQPALIYWLWQILQAI